MKKAIVALAMMFPFVASAIQPSAGVFQLKGSTTVGYSSESNEVKLSDGSKEKTDTTRLNAEVQGLYYLAPGIGVGLVLGYTTETQKSGGQKLITDTTLIGPAVGLDYALTPEVGLFAEAAVGYSAGSRELDPATTLFPEKFSYSGYGFELVGGLKYFLERHFSFDLGVSYTYLSMESDQDVYGKPTVKDGSLGVNLGVSVYFGGK